MIIWIIVGNTNTARFYQYDKKSHELSFIKQIDHPEAKLKTSEIVSDRNGRYQTDTSAGGAYSPNLDPKEVEIEKFLLELAKELNDARVKHLYEQLFIVMASKASGTLNNHLNANVREIIAGYVHKDLVNISESALQEALKRELSPTKET